MSVSNHAHTLFTSATAGTGTAIELDYRFDGTQNRTVFCTKNTADTISVEVSPDGTSYFQYFLFPTGTTAGTIVIVGPARFVRAVKVGAAAVCNVLLLG